MAEMGRRRERSFGRWGTPWAAVLALSWVGCADLLDLPSNPRLDEPAAETTGSPPSGGGASRGEPLTPPEPIYTNGSSDTAAVDEPGSVSAGPTAPGDDPEPAASTDGRGAAGSGSLPPDAGVLPPPEPDAAAPTPEQPAPEQPALGGCVPPESLGPNGRCFLVVTETLAWEDARANCRGRGDDWDLAAIRDEAVNTFIGALTDEEAWFGGSDADTEGSWRWVSDGSAFWSGDGTTGRTVNGAFEAWNSDEPNGRGNSDCVRTVPIARTGQGLTWADLECFELRTSICEGPPL